VLPVVVKIILIQKALAKTKTELGQGNGVWVIGEREASLVRNPVIFPVDVKTMQVGITPTHANLNRVIRSAILWSLRKSNRRQIIGLMPRRTTLNW
jgi:hypothetical protein